MQCDLIIDGNYILSKNVFYLHKSNLLYGALSMSLKTSVDNYRNLYPFTNVYLVSDSKEKSWRKRLLSSYKGKRKKDSNIDWEFVYNAYQEFKDGLGMGIRVLEAPTIEGDDWISYVCDKSNKEGRSVMMISNDHDLKQLIKYSIEPLCINIMTNELLNRQRLFVPNNYGIFLDKLSKRPNDIFVLNDDLEFILLVSKLQSKGELIEINPTEELIIKLIMGDRSDNIDSVWFKIKNGKQYGIGERGAKKIYDKYIDEFGDVDLADSSLYENIADLICENKKLSTSIMAELINNIEENVRLIDLRLSNLPSDIVTKMESVYNG